MEKRIARDGQAYTEQEFLNHYGWNKGWNEWSKSSVEKPVENTVSASACASESSAEYHRIFSLWRSHSDELHTPFPKSEPCLEWWWRCQAQCPECLSQCTKCRGHSGGHCCPSCGPEDMMKRTESSNQRISQSCKTWASKPWPAQL